jgi:PAS domain S-box-containing protein
MSESGYSAEELEGKSFWNFVHPDYKNEVTAFYLNQLNKKIEFTRKEFPILSKRGLIIWTQQEVCAQINKRGEVTCFEIFGTVITERKKTELELNEIVDKHKRLMKEIPDGYYHLDLQGNLLEYNESLLTLIGYDEDSTIGLNYRQLSPNKEIAKFTKQAFNKVFKTKKRLTELEWELSKKNREIIYVSTSISPIIDKKTNKVIGFEGILRDITERIKELKEMTKLATKDMLTGLYNRFWFIEFVKKDMAKGFRTKVGTAAVLFIDGNEFKEINDNLGHEEGDNLLKNISQALVKSVRKTDVIS